jgi:hypothetical protein
MMAEAIRFLPDLGSRVSCGDGSAPPAGPLHFAVAIRRAPTRLSPFVHLWLR